MMWKTAFYLDTAVSLALQGFLSLAVLGLSMWEGNATMQLPFVMLLLSLSISGRICGWIAAETYNLALNWIFFVLITLDTLLWLIALAMLSRMRTKDAGFDQANRLIFMVVLVLCARFIFLRVFPWTL